MAKLYGWGAAIVIIGALFKIQHWEGASLMLILGLGTEAFIFFMSAFEKPHEEPDWSLVYPQLATGEGAEKTPTQQLDNMLADANIDATMIESWETACVTWVSRPPKWVKWQTLPWPPKTTATPW